MSSLKFALRTLFKTPFVTIIAIVSLALGIGANAAIFSCFNQMLLESLTVPRSRPQLVNLAAPGPKPGSQSCRQAGDCDAVFSYAMFRDLQKVQTVVHRHRGAPPASARTWPIEGQTMSGEGMLVSGQLLPGPPGAAGARAPVRLERRSPRRRVAGRRPQPRLLDDAVRARIPACSNKTIIVNGQTLTIVGVAPRGFDGTTLGTEPQVFVPITLRGTMSPGFNAAGANRQTYWAYLFARLRPGVSIEQARASLNAQYHAIVNDVEAPLQQGMSDATMARFRAKPIVVEPGGLGQSTARSEAKTPLLLAARRHRLRAADRVRQHRQPAARALRRARGEMAVRLSLGASRGAPDRAAADRVAAARGVRRSRRPARRALDAAADPVAAAGRSGGDDGLRRSARRRMLFAGALTIGTGLLFGLFPALHSTRPDLVSTLKSQAGQPSGARGAQRFRARRSPRRRSRCR